MLEGEGEEKSGKKEMYQGAGIERVDHSRVVVIGEVGLHFFNGR